MDKKVSEDRRHVIVEYRNGKDLVGTRSDHRMLILYRIYEYTINYETGSVRYDIAIGLQASQEKVPW